MRNRFFQALYRQKQTESKLKNPNNFTCLQGNDVISAHVSDHHPVIHDTVLSWNIMMQGKKRGNGKGYNNGFGLLEDEKTYLTRLKKIAAVIAEIILENPEIATIGLCEGPKEFIHIEKLQHFLQKFVVMRRFISQKTFYMPKQSEWGLLMLTDQANQVSEVIMDFMKQSCMRNKLANRLQLWKLTCNGKESFVALGHFPFGGDEHATERNQLTLASHEYRGIINFLLQQYANAPLILCADFNFNPYLINQPQDRILDQIPQQNSIVLTEDKLSQGAIKAVTVDGILLSQQAKQKHMSNKATVNLFMKLKQEYHFFKAIFDAQLQKVLLDKSESWVGFTAS